MSTSHFNHDQSEHVAHNHAEQFTPDHARTGDRHAGSHHWMMLACCIPMVVIAIALVATRTVGVGFLLIALACTAMMALMMRGMDHGDRP